MLQRIVSAAILAGFVKKRPVTGAFVIVRRLSFLKYRMAMYSFFESFSTFLNDNVRDLSSRTPSFSLEDRIRAVFEKSKVSVFTNGTGISEVEKILDVVKKSGVTKVDFLRLSNVENFEPNETNDNVNCILVDLSPYRLHHRAVIEKFLKATCRDRFPLIFIKGDCVGGLKELQQLSDKNALPEYYKKHEYDLIVIGGGSGGLAASKRAALKSKKVAVLDFVKPSPTGTTWGLGGTCVNVGCIPKKLMHQSAILRKSLEDAQKFGWSFSGDAMLDWKALVTNVKNHILSLNYGQKVDLRQKNCTYVNGYGSFVNSHTIKAVQKNGKETLMTADRFLVATGVRPRYLDIPGANDLCITSDDLFTLSYPPGKTLVVGASYVSLECAGFLQGVGFDVTVMVRSILLRGFDQDMAERIGSHMEGHGVKFIRQAIPTKIEKLEDGLPPLLKVTFTQKSEDGDIEQTAEYNTVLLAIGRDAVTDEVNLDAIGVTRSKDKKVVCFDNEQSTSVPHVYAIGDVSKGKPELTPVAIQASRSLMDRLYDRELVLFDYANIPTTVFTPLEYGCCGLSEETAKEKFGDKAVVYHCTFIPLEFTVPKRQSDINSCYAKVIFHGNPEKPKELKIVGMHYLGPNAGEVMQGFGIALKMGATMRDLQDLVGIHPTTAEIFTFGSMQLKTGEPLKATGC